MDRKLFSVITKSVHSEWFNYLLPEDIELLENIIQQIISRGEKLVPATPDLILKCLSINPKDIKVCIVGQDPYPTPNIATGYAFGCNIVQPSLEIMMRELVKEYGECDLDTTLIDWVNQGVLLLNIGLSTVQYKPSEHIDLWKPLTKRILKIVNDLKFTETESNSIVFVGLGKIANEVLGQTVIEGWNYHIKRNHPAAEKHGTVKFEGFYKECNELLIQANRESILWHTRTK